jgi:hypothetical protein
MGNYIESATLWKHLGHDAYTKVRTEIVGTGNGSANTWDLDHSNIISGSITLYTGGNTVSSSAYTSDLDEGKITGLTAGTGSVITTDYDYADIPDSIIQDLISYAEKELEEKTGRNFIQNTGEIEYLDVESEQDVFFLNKYPILTLSSVECNTASSVTDTPGWSTSTEGIGKDYIANASDLAIGRIRFIDNNPDSGINRLKVTYDWGYSSTPELVKELTILLAERRMVNSTIYKSIFKGNDNFTPVRLEETEQSIQRLTNMLKKQSLEIA